MDKILLIDGHSIMNRAFYGVPELTNSKGLHTNAVYGFLNIMLKVIEEEKADHLAVAFDLHAPTFRHKMFAEYKGTRKPMPEELREQIPVIKDVLKAMNIPILTMEGFEADDILGTVAKRMQAEGKEVSILSGDRDLLQLSDEHIKICLPKTVKRVTEVHYYYPEDVKREYGIAPIEVIDLKALMGDSSDNIPGVPSVGEKTATAIISAYHTIEAAYEHLDELKPPRAQKALREHWDMAVMSKQLATINTHVEIPFSFDDAHVGDMFSPEGYQWMKDLEFRALAQRFAGADAGESEPAVKFIPVTDRKKAEDLFAKAKKASSAGIQLEIADGKILACGLAFGPEEAFVLIAEQEKQEEETCTQMEMFPELAGQNSGRKKTSSAGDDLGVTGCYLSKKAEELFRIHPKLTVMDLKVQLPFLANTDRTVVDGGRNDDGNRAVMDAGIAGYLLNPLKDTYGYDDIARDYLGMTIPAREELLGKCTIGQALSGTAETGRKSRKESDGETDPEELRRKAFEVIGYDAYIAWKSRDVLEDKMRETGMLDLFYDIEMPTVYTLYHMEEEGIIVLPEELKAYAAKLQVRIGELEKEIYAETGREFNINSPKQLGEILFGEMKLPGGKKTKTGYSTAATVLDKLAPDYPFVQKVLDYRQYTKLKSTYAEGLQQYIREDGRIHGTFNQTITATGRISSTEPNLQNIPVRMELGRELRKLFVPQEGCIFTDADYSQIELRVLAGMSGDENLIAAYRDAEDIHAITASQVFHVPLSEVTPELRRNAKAVNFGIVYGISNFGLSNNLSISRQEAAGYIERYFEAYPGVKQFIDRLVSDAKEKHYSETLFGRRRPIPELESGNFMQRQFGERVAMNAPIQGTAADIIKIAMIRVDRRLRREGLKSRLVLQIHDELLIETRKDEAEAVRNILSEEMKHAADLPVSLEISMSEGQSWFETK